MPFRTSILVLITILGYSLRCCGQRVVIPKWHAVQESYWAFSLDYLAIDDSGRFLTDPFNVEEHWQVLPYPSRISLSRKTTNSLSYHLLASYSMYAEGKIVDGQPLSENSDYWSVDIHSRFHLSNTLGWGRFIDPYLGLGAGLNRVNKRNQLTLKAWVGALFWVADQWALQFSSTAKFSMTSEGTNHLVHSAGLVYRFSIE